MALPEYYIVGNRPVKLVPTRSGGSVVLKMNWETGAFEYGMEYFSRLYFDHDDVEEVSEDEFILAVERYRSRNLPGEGPRFALYALINAMVDKAEKEGRRLTSEEMAVVTELRRQTYALFQAEHPDPVYD